MSMTNPIGFELADGLELAGVGIDELWWRYAANGGQADAALLADRVTGTARSDGVEHDLIAQTLNECFLDRGTSTFPVGYALRRGGSSRFTVVRGHGARRGASSGNDDVRRRALEARSRSALAARQAAALQASAARLMQNSGQWDYAQRARERAINAQNRAIAPIGTLPPRAASN